MLATEYTGRSPSVWRRWLTALGRGSTVKDRGGLRGLTDTELDASPAVERSCDVAESPGSMPDELELLLLLLLSPESLP